VACDATAPRRVAQGRQALDERGEEPPGGREHRLASEVVPERVRPRQRRDDEPNPVGRQHLRPEHALHGAPDRYRGGVGAPGGAVGKLARPEQLRHSLEGRRARERERIAAAVEPASPLDRRDRGFDAHLAIGADVGPTA